MGGDQTPLRRTMKMALFGSRRKAKPSDDHIPHLSPIANSVVSRCSKILTISAEQLQQKFKLEMPDHVTQSAVYARHLLEYCSYKALHIMTRQPDYLADKKFRHLTFDMMLAWESPGMGDESLPNETASCNHLEFEDENGGSFFHTNSTNMAVQVDNKKTVGLEAFARITPACPTIADSITVRNIFDALTCSSGGELNFPIYKKYLKVLNKVIKTTQNVLGTPIVSTLQLTNGEIILDVDGLTPTQPVLQHTGKSTWPGRLTLTNYALYFEAVGVGSYDKAVKCELTTEVKPIIKRELTGPLGARLFDKAVMYKSNLLTEPIYFEFPEFKGHLRRDYWLALIQEVIQVHRFIRKFNVTEIRQQEALSKAILGIFRYHAVKKAFHIIPSHSKSILVFNLAESLTEGDKILEALNDHLELLTTGFYSHDLVDISSDIKSQAHMFPVSLNALTRMGFISVKKEDMDGEREFPIGDVCVGLISTVELAVKESLCHSGRVEEARASVKQVKLEGIDTNLALMQELLVPLVKSGKWLCFLAEWEDPFISTSVLILIIFLYVSGWIRYVLPGMFLSVAVLMLWQKFRSKRQPIKAFKVTPPPSKNAVEQILLLQETISQLETFIQEVNVILLKLRALLLSATPQATSKAALILTVIAVIFTVVPLSNLLMLLLLEAFTRDMPLRKISSERFGRRLKDWWLQVPAAPIQIAKPEDNKKKK